MTSNALGLLVTVTHSNSNTVFINECDKRTNSKERNKERNRSNGKLKKFK